MADINMTPLGGVGSTKDRFFVNEGMPGIKKCILTDRFEDGKPIYAEE